MDGGREYVKYCIETFSTNAASFMIIIVMISRKLRGKTKKHKTEDQAEEATEYEDLNA